MENSLGGEIKLEYTCDQKSISSGLLSDLNCTLSESECDEPKTKEKEDTLNRLSTESFKLSFLQEYRSTESPSGLSFSFFLKTDKDSVIFENDQVSVSKEIDFEWFAEKLAKVGKIESLKEYQDLILGNESECEYLISLSIGVIREINSKLEDSHQESFVTNSSGNLELNSIKISGSSARFSRCEIIRVLELIAINSEFDRQERLLFLHFLLRSAIEQNNRTKFTEIIRFLYHLSELRRFNDAFLFMLDDIHYFGDSSKVEEGHSEIDFLVDVVKSEFFRHDLSKPTQITYLGFLTNVSSCSRKINYNHVTKNDIWRKELLNETLWEVVGGESTSLGSFFDRMSCHKLSISDISEVHSNCLHIAFISLVKLSDKSKLNDHCKNLVEKLNKLDEIACITDIKSLNLFNPEGGFFIRQEESEIDDSWQAAMDESKSHSNTDPKSSTCLRNTEKTLDLSKNRYDGALDDLGGVYSLAAQFGDENATSQVNPSVLSEEDYDRKRRRRELVNDSCNSCCTIF